MRRRSRRTWATPRSRRRTTSTASSCPAPRPKRQLLSTRTSPVRTPTCASRRFSRNEVAPFDFRGLLVGQVQLRWYALLVLLDPLSPRVPLIRPPYRAEPTA